jgi:hypothetical protein
VIYRRRPRKFGPWHLGSKLMSEEWSGDFEIDDGDEAEEAVDTLMAS